ncbi:MAG: DNA polymerase IV, partial [Gammaproteobacteria bacterium]|nr:DNA polymerase IV [Gammaproteobacteria bacterium]
LVQLVAPRLREHGLWSRTIQIKLRYSDFKTLTRAKTLEEATQLDKVILETVRKLFRDNWS